MKTLLFKRLPYKKTIIYGGEITDDTVNQPLFAYDMKSLAEALHERLDTQVQGDLPYDEDNEFTRQFSFDNKAYSKEDAKQ